jgi:hypothetical protein
LIRVATKSSAAFLQHLFFVTGLQVNFSDAGNAKFPRFSRLG